MDRAREALDAGAAWRARDILTEYVETDRDPEALAFLGEVLNRMGDLPRAGAMWFAAGAKGPEVDRAVAAWRERAHDDFAAMWEDLPASVQDQPRAPRIEALREKAMAADPAVVEPPLARLPGTDVGDDVGDDGDSGTDAAQVIAWVLAAIFVVLAVVGAVTVLGWLVPG